MGEEVVRSRDWREDGGHWVTHRGRQGSQNKVLALFACLRADVIMASEQGATLLSGSWISLK